MFTVHFLFCLTLSIIVVTRAELLNRGDLLLSLQPVGLKHCVQDILDLFPDLQLSHLTLLENLYREPGDEFQELNVLEFAILSRCIFVLLVYDSHLALRMASLNLLIAELVAQDFVEEPLKVGQRNNFLIHGLVIGSLLVLCKLVKDFVDLVLIHCKD